MPHGASLLTSIASKQAQWSDETKEGKDYIYTGCPISIEMKVMLIADEWKHETDFVL